MGLASCGPPVPRGQFGVYQPPFKHLVLPNGLQLVVYRVSRWTFTNGQQPLLQLEYEAPFSVAQAAQVRSLAYQIWPLFVPYVEGMQLQAASITATNLERHSFGPFGTSSTHHQSVLAVKDSTGAWHFQGDSVPLPAPKPGQPLAIIDVDNKPMPVPAPVATH